MLTIWEIHFFYDGFFIDLFFVKSGRVVGGCNVWVDRRVPISRVYTIKYTP